MEKIILFYKYVSLDNPQAILHTQKTLCKSLNLKGRIVLAHEGINGTLGGSVESLNLYKKAMRENPLFADIDFKEAAGSSEYFPRLRVVVKSEIVYLGQSAEAAPIAKTGKHLTPEQAHTLMEHRPKDLLVFDARNAYESRIGTFVNAVTPNINHFRDLPTYIDNNLEQFKDKEVLMFCTGGVRCERASAYLKLKDVAKEVYQINGGIHRYAEQFPDGFFRGKNYVFDGRVAVKVTDDVLTVCDQCQKPCDEYTNCLNASCNKMFIGCNECITTFGNACSTSCQHLLTSGQVHPRPMAKKISVTTPAEHSV